MPIFTRKSISTMVTSTNSIHVIRGHVVFIRFIVIDARFLTFIINASLLHTQFDQSFDMPLHHRKVLHVAILSADHLMIQSYLFQVEFTYSASQELYTRLIFCRALLLFDIGRFYTHLSVLLSNYIRVKQWDIITHPCPNFNGGLVKPPLKLGHGWLITSRCFT